MASRVVRQRDVQGVRLQEGRDIAEHEGPAEAAACPARPDVSIAEAHRRGCSGPSRQMTALTPQGPRRRPAATRAEASGQPGTGADAGTGRPMQRAQAEAARAPGGRTSRHGRRRTGRTAGHGRPGHRGRPGRRGYIRHGIADGGVRAATRAVTPHPAARRARRGCRGGDRRSAGPEPRRAAAPDEDSGRRQSPAQTIRPPRASSRSTPAGCSASTPPGPSSPDTTKRT